jgi:hypothetical protein
MSRRSKAASILAYCRTAPIDELRVVLEMGREEYKQRQANGGQAVVQLPAPKRKPRKQARTSALPAGDVHAQQTGINPNAA